MDRERVRLKVRDQRDEKRLEIPYETVYKDHASFTEQKPGFNYEESKLKVSLNQNELIGGSIIKEQNFGL